MFLRFACLSWFSSEEEKLRSTPVDAIEILSVAFPKRNKFLHRILHAEPFEFILFGFVSYWIGASCRSHSALGEGFN